MFGVAVSPPSLLSSSHSARPLSDNQVPSVAVSFTNVTSVCNYDTSHAAFFAQNQLHNHTQSKKVPTLAYSCA